MSDRRPWRLSGDETPSRRWRFVGAGSRRSSLDLRAKLASGRTSTAFVRALGPLSALVGRSLDAGPLPAQRRVAATAATAHYRLTLTMTIPRRDSPQACSVSVPRWHGNA